MGPNEQHPASHTVLYRYCMGEVGLNQDKNPLPGTGVLAHDRRVHVSHSGQADRELNTLATPFDSTK